MKKIKIIDEEVKFEDINPYNRPVVSKTDKKGIIIYTNSVFRALSGYKKGEMLGKPHSIVRHPDMPKQVFANMWKTILAGKPWNGIIKNLRKDGRYYWVDAYIEPIFKNHNIISFISVRRPVSEEMKKKYEQIYKEMREKEQKNH